MKKPTSVCAALNALPPQVETHGLTFKLEIFDNYSRPDNLDIRVCYVLEESSWRSYSGPAALLGEPGSWFNPFAKGAQESFLVLLWGIESDKELIEALLDARAWLLRQGIIQAEQYPAFEAPEGA